MKKGMMVMTMLVALSFLVSVIAVAPAVAKQVTKTPPTATQQTPAKAPVAPAQMPKAKFWDLEFDRLDVKGVVIKKGGGNKTINVKVGETLQFTAHYKVKTLPIGDITQADANYWGSGKFLYANHLLIVNHDAQGNNYIRLFDTNRSLPKFTWQNVQGWKRGGGKSNDPKIWTELSAFQWTPGAECVGHNVYINVFCADWYKNIPEPDELNNGFVDANLLVTFIVTP